MDTATSGLEFCPRLRDMIESGRAELPNGETTVIRGPSTLNNLLAIRHFILAEELDSTLEIGLAFGASALTFLTSLAEVGASGFHHTAIDPFQTAFWKSAAIHNVKSVGLADHFTHLEQESAWALPDLWQEGKQYQLVYVDGSHIFEDVFVDFFFSCRLLENRGLLLFDDCTDKHVAKVIRFIDKNYSPILQREDLSVVGPKSVKRRVANALGIRQLVAYRKIGDTPRKWNAPFTNF